VFERTAQTVSWKFAVHPVVALLNKRNLEKQNGVAAAESSVRFVVLGAKIVTVYNLRDRHLEDSPLSAGWRILRTQKTY
jgi:hypothetical protein